MSGEEPVSSRVRRMLPSVSEVLKELTSRAQVEPDVAFRAAREVCAEELKRIRDVGGDSVPLEELVQRAYQRATATYPAASASLPPRPAPPSPITPPAPAAEPEQGGEDPFSETAGAMDLRWDREAREPFTEPQQAGAPRSAGALRAAFEGAPGPEAAPATLGLPYEPTVTLPAPFGPAAGEADHGPGAPSVPEPEQAEGPGDETLGRLSREAEAIDLRSVLKGAQGQRGLDFPSASPATQPEAASPAAAERVPAPFEDEEETVLTIPRGGRRGNRGEGGSRVGVVLGTVFGLLALAALGYLLVGLWLERDLKPAPVAVARPRPSRPAGPAVTAPATGAAPSAPASPAVTPVASPPSPAAAPAGSAPTVEPRAAAPAVSPVPAPTRSVARPTLPAPQATQAPAAAIRIPPKGAALAAVTPAPVAAVPSPAASAAVRASRDGLVVTKDRAGQPQVFSIHFTSYKDRAAAERDLKRIEALVGRPGFVAEVNLGEKGVWQRVMIGAFATQQEAKGVREELAAKGTRDLGWVYRVVGPDGAEPR